MLAFFVPTICSLHLPSSINTSLKSFTATSFQRRGTPHLSKITFVDCAGTENCCRLGTVNSPAGTFCSLWPCQKNELAKARFFVPAVCRYSFFVAGFLTFIVKKLNCIPVLSNGEILCCANGWDFLWWRAQSLYQENPPNLAVFLCQKSDVLFDSSTLSSLL